MTDPKPADSPRWSRAWLVIAVGLFVLAVLYTLYFARPVIVPIMIAVLLNYLCSPVIRWLRRRARMPYPAGALLVIAILFGTFALTVYNLAAPAAAWIAKGPESLRRIETRLAGLKGSVARVSETAERVEEMTRVESDTPEVTVKPAGLGATVLGGTQAFLAGVVIVFTLLYFLLAEGDRFTEKMVKVLPQKRDKKVVLTILRETERGVSTYLAGVTIANIVLGVLTGVAVWLIGLPNPVLWGLVGGLCNYVPYIGGLVATVVLVLAGLSTFDSLGRALLPGVVYLVLTNVESFVTPVLVGKRLTLNAVVVFSSVLFWGWLWGVPGALLAVPIMASLKIVCDHVPALSSVGEFLAD